MRMHHHPRHHRPPDSPRHADGADAPPGASREPEPVHDFLDPARVRLWREENGRLRLAIEDDRCYLDVKVVRAFPRSEPDRYVGLLTAATGRVIALVADPDGLDAESRRLVTEALDRHYFLPNIVRVTSLKEEFGAVYIEAVTDRGKRRFVVRGIRDSIEQSGDGELLIPDADGTRYRIPDWRDLDPKSRRLLERVV